MLHHTDVISSPHALRYTYTYVSLHVCARVWMYCIYLPILIDFLYALDTRALPRNTETTIYIYIYTVASRYVVHIKRNVYNIYIYIYVSRTFNWICFTRRGVPLLLAFLTNVTNRDHRIKSYVRVYDYFSAKYKMYVIAVLRKFPLGRFSIR